MVLRTPKKLRSIHPPQTDGGHASHLILLETVMNYFLNRIVGSATLVLVVFYCLGCKESPPEPQPPTPKDPRTYTWTIDTIAYPGSSQTLMTDIWASSSTNVYVVGHNDQNRGQMYHFDGAKWMPVRLAAADGGTIVGPFDLSAIYGFSSQDIWAVGEKIYTHPTPPPNFLDSSLIIHFDGIQWREFTIQRKRALYDVWGANATSVWAVGEEGTAYFFDGGHWQQRRIREDALLKNVSGSSSSDVYVLGSKLDTSPYDSIRSYIFNFDGQSWALRDSLIQNTFPPMHSFGIADLWALSSSEVFSVGHGIFKKTGNGWIKVFEDNTTVTGIGGNGSNNIFAVGVGIYHFNGVNWQRYSQFQNFPGVIVRVWLDGSEVFAVGHDGNRSYVFHGK